MGVLHGLTGDIVPFYWEYTHQNAFENIKNLAVLCKDHHKKPLKYSEYVLPVGIMADGCSMGIAGVFVCQGKD